MGLFGRRTGARLIDSDDKVPAGSTAVDEWPDCISEAGCGRTRPRYVFPGELAPPEMSERRTSPPAIKDSERRPPPVPEIRSAMKLPAASIFLMSTPQEAS